MVYACLVGTDPILLSGRFDVHMDSGCIVFGGICFGDIRFADINSMIVSCGIRFSNVHGVGSCSVGCSRIGFNCLTVFSGIYSFRSGSLASMAVASHLEAAAASYSVIVHRRLICQ